MSQKTPVDNTSRNVIVIALVAALIMVGALFLNSQGGAPGGSAPTVVAGGGNSPVSVAGENCRELDAASSPVQTTASGLQYQPLRDCDGPQPTAASTVTVHYRGTLTDGTPFDSSYDRGQPSSFPLNNVIDGWIEGLQLMSVGERFLFTIPGNLAYGAQGRPPAIPPNATLIFEIELLGIQ
jgi:FKBP-type peptidyl-prolyl cis-trans isomerase